MRILLTGLVVATLLACATAAQSPSQQPAVSTPAVREEPVPSSPQCTMPDTSVHRLPFTREDDLDGARYVWFSNCRAGLPYSYVRAADVPQSESFVEIDATTPSGGPRPGDIAWWPTFMGVIASPAGPIMAAGGPLQLSDLEKRLGPPRFFRRLVPRQK